MACRWEAIPQPARPCRRPHPASSAMDVARNVVGSSHRWLTARQFFFVEAYNHIYKRREAFCAVSGARNHAAILAAARCPPVVRRFGAFRFGASIALRRRPRIGARSQAPIRGSFYHAKGHLCPVLGFSRAKTKYYYKFSYG
eukprot:scaffold183449_cov18-Prasinocladus_malaysianus.AAC.2